MENLLTPLKILAAALAAYLLGAIPTALLYSHLAHGADIRALGDGNMGARNTRRIFGWRAGVLVALADIVKGALAVWLAKVLALPELWQYTCGALSILGHDFPVFARFKGGQGFAVTTGVFLGLFPALTVIGALIYAVVYFTTRNSDLGAGLGMGFIAAAQWLTGGSLASIVFIVLLLLFIPLKKWLDRARRQEIEQNAGSGPSF
ncbi:MAG: glycerol-3-phosphate acyltransferase [Anaerolineaceae bacterium]